MSRSDTLVKDFTVGGIPRRMLAFMLPILAANALQVLYSAIDMVIVGRYIGSAAISAVSSGSQFVNFATLLCAGFCTGGQVVMGHYIGSGENNRLNRLIGTLFSFILILGLVFSVLAVCIRVPILTLLNTPVQAYEMAEDYALICGAGLFFTFGYNMVAAALRGMGDSFHPFLFIALASVLNLLLDLLFVALFKMGVAGAAWATIIGQAVSFVCSIVFLYRKRDSFGFDFKRSSWKMEKAHLRAITKQGLPMAISSSAVYVSMFVVNSMVNALGVVESATFGIGLKIDDVCNKISVSIRFAATPMVAQNYASGNMRRVKRIVCWSFLYGCIIHGLFIAAYLIFGRQMFSIFTKDPEVINLSVVFISAIIWSFIPLALMRGTNAFIQGIGRAKFSMALGIVDGVVLRISLSYIFGIWAGMGFYGFVLGYGLAVLGNVIPGILFMFFGRWNSKSKSIV